jgi:hypothetical protein
MANAVKFLSTLQFWRESVVVNNPPQKLIETATTSHLKTENTQVVGTTHEAVAAGDVTDSAMAHIENLHATAIVSVGGDDTGSFVPWFTIPPGERAHLPRVSSLAATYLKSDTASTNVQVTLIKIAS